MKLFDVIALINTHFFYFVVQDFPSYMSSLASVNPISAVGDGDDGGFVGGRRILQPTNLTPRTVKENTNWRVTTEELRNDLYHKVQDFR